MVRTNLVLFALVLPLVACGGGDDSSPPPISLPDPTPTPTPSPAPPPTPTITQAVATYLHTFQIEPNDGGQPNGPLLEASDGNFYGTTRAGGVNECRSDSIPCGTIFKITPNGQETVLYSFGASASDGYTPSGPLIQGSDGALYGVTGNGGDFSGGTIYKITLDGIYTALYSFGGSSSDGFVPTGGLVQASDGNFYGVTGSGGENECLNIPQEGPNCGTVFKVTPDGAHTVIYSFGDSRTDGVTPNGLMQASDGNFYGTTLNGGANACGSVGTNNCGTVFKVTPDGVGTTLYSFGASITDAIAPTGPLLEGSDGALYGTSVSGGGGTCGHAFGCGTVFRVTTAGRLSILYAFAATTEPGISPMTDGYGPTSYLIQDSNGDFFGTTGHGGDTPASQNGTFYKLNMSGVKTILYSFGPNGENPSSPLGGVIQATDGAFYGVTAYNGKLGAVGARSGSGTVFKLELQ